MYNVIDSASAVGILSIQFLKHSHVHTLGGEEIMLTGKKYSPVVWIGSLLFILSCALTDACPRPMFAQLDSSLPAAAVFILAVLADTWTYSALRERLP